MNATKYTPREDTVILTLTNEITRTQKLTLMSQTGILRSDVMGHYVTLIQNPAGT